MNREARRSVRRIEMVGLPGVGKTATARALSQRQRQRGVTTIDLRQLPLVVAASRLFINPRRWRPVAKIVACVFRGVDGPRRARAHRSWMLVKGIARTTTTLHANATHESWAIAEEGPVTGLMALRWYDGNTRINALRTLAGIYGDVDIVVLAAPVDVVRDRRGRRQAPDPHGAPRRWRWLVTTPPRASFGDREASFDTDISLLTSEFRTVVIDVDAAWTPDEVAARVEASLARSGRA